MYTLRSSDGDVTMLHRGQVLLLPRLCSQHSSQWVCQHCTDVTGFSYVFCNGELISFLGQGRGQRSAIASWAGSLASQTVQPALLTMGVPTLY